MPSENNQQPFASPDDSGSVPMDGVRAPMRIPEAVPAPADVKVNTRVKRVRSLILLAGGMLYVGYVVWCLALITLLPSPTGDMQTLVSAGLVSSVAGLAFLLLIGFLALKRIGASSASVSVKQRSLFRVIVALIPAIAASAAVPLLITREPSLPLDIVSPTTASELVAPLSVTLSAQRAVDILSKQGLKVAKFQWDTDGDGKPNDESVVPTTTVLIERQGSYSVVARIILSDSSTRRLTRSFVISQAVFSVTPAKPIVGNPVSFGVSHLLSDPKQLLDVTWDYGDSSPQEKTKNTETVHTYYTVGDYTVSVVIQLQNKTQLSFSRLIRVTEPPPLPFPAALASEPKVLVGPAPLSAIFRVETTVPVREVSWNFGDNKEEKGADLLRVGHTFDREGVYPVTVRVRSGSGDVAELGTIVRVTPPLSLPDLSFDGEPEVKGNKVKGEAPLHVTITPKTSIPLVQFGWDTQGTEDAKVTGTTVDATYRKPGTYTLILTGVDAENKSFRLPMSIEVTSPSPEPIILMKPENGEAPLRVLFDASQSFVPEGVKIAGFKWSFGDTGNLGRVEEPSTARTEHTYEIPGEYVVTLKIVTTTGDEYSANRTIVVRKPSLSACLNASRVTVQAGKGIEFDSSCSTGVPQSYLWDVRREDQPDIVQAQSALQNYVHVFNDPGVYTVSLILKDKWGAQDRTSLSITVTP
jgi:PKD repeat protein